MTDLVTALSGGIQTYQPAISSLDLAFCDLHNLEPRRGRLYASLALTDFSADLAAVGDYVVGFGYYQFGDNQTANLYAVTTKAIYWFDFVAGQFSSTPVYTYATASSVPPAFLQDLDSLFVVRYKQPVIKLQSAVATVSEMPRARYGLVFNSHAFLANVGSASSTNQSKVQWSDLELFESFEVDPTQSEADFFVLEPGAGEITGLSLQRGSGIIYTPTSIWIATYVGFPGSFTFQPLFTGNGNQYHHAVVRAKELDYFIGLDNFYVLNGYQLEPIGDAVWERFIGELKKEPNCSVFGYLDTRNTQVFWVYQKEDDTYASVVYNYKEQKWSFRDSQQISAFFDSPRINLRGYIVIDDVSETIDDVTGTPDGDDFVFSRNFPQLLGAFNSRKVLTWGTHALGTCRFETFDFYADNIEQVKEINRLTLDFKSTGSPQLQLFVGTRHSQNDDVTWSAAIDKEVQDGSQSFFSHSQAVGKYVRFKVVVTNETNHELKEMLMWSMTPTNRSNSDAAR